MHQSVCLFGCATYRGRVTRRRGPRKSLTASDFTSYAESWIRTSEKYSAVWTSLSNAAVSSAIRSLKPVTTMISCSYCALCRPWRFPTKYEIAPLRTTPKMVSAAHSRSNLLQGLLDHFSRMQSKPNTKSKGVATMTHSYPSFFSPMS
jgi:hypothetical protein